MKGSILDAVGGDAKAIAKRLDSGDRGKLDELSALVERGRLRPHVGAVYSLADIPLAHARLESRDNGIRGKIAIAVEPSVDPAQAFAR